MKLLLDTHTFLWFVTTDPRLGTAALKAIRERTNVCLISVASIWEMGIKTSLGRLTLARPFREFVTRQISVNSLTILPISVEHTIAAAELPYHHRDPFDRLLVAQALTESIPFLSAHLTLDQYGISRVW